ncbi:MAG: IS30 family transposase [Candidatus Paceibacteria bacterium]|jgi:IS30 family transposase
MHTQHKSFKQIRQIERERIEELIQADQTPKQIALILGRHPATIVREIQRNSKGDGSYTTIYAQKKTIERRYSAKESSRKIENDSDLETSIIALMSDTDPMRGDWSPEVIANSSLKGRVSHTTIYAWVKRSRPELKKLLHFQGRRRARYGSVATRLHREMSLPSIEDRPQSVESRSHIGHFEGDTVIVNGGRIHTLVERKSRFLIGSLITHKGVGLAIKISEDAVEKLSVLPLQYRQTITYDQGSEFAWWDEIEKGLDGTKIYFAHPHSPWERGTNERHNGLMRRYIPKKKYSGIITHEDVAETVRRINHRPRKILNWRTSCEVFGKCCGRSFN